MAENPRGKHGQIADDLARVLGLDPAAVRAQFAYYFDHVAIAAET